MTDKWTPGPLTVMPAGDGYNSVIAPADPDTGPWWTAVIECSDITHGSRVAEFLGASDDMAKALDQFIQLGKDSRASRTNPNTTFVDTRDWQAFLEAARAALAKARGRT